MGHPEDHHAVWLDGAPQGLSDEKKRTRGRFAVVASVHPCAGLSERRG